MPIITDATEATMNLNTPTIHHGPLSEADLPIPAPRSWAMHRIPAGCDQQGRLPEAGHAATGIGENYDEPGVGLAEVWSYTTPGMRAFFVAAAVVLVLVVFR